MTTAASILMLAGSTIALVAGIGLLRFSTQYARFHAAGKAAPVAFVVTAAGVATELGGAGAILVALASAAMILTLPVGVHLLFRAVHRNDSTLPLEFETLTDPAQPEAAPKSPLRRP